MKNIISKKNSIMNKANKILTLFSVLAVIVFISSCVNDDDYNTPNLTISTPNIPANNITTFRALVSRYEQAVNDGDAIAVFDEEQDIFVEGYVVSSDQAGNFFEELIVQNKMDDSNPDEDPRLGFNVQINTRGLYETYEIGRKIYIKMNGLAVGESNGVLIIGKANGNSVDQIQEYEYRDFIIRDPEVVTITPKIAAIGDLTEQDENTLIQLDNMQINRNELALTFAGEPADAFDGFRTLESCDTNAALALQTSTFADFKSLQVPQNVGSIQGIFSRDFGDDFNVFIISSIANINFDNPERCDPIELDCGLASSQGIQNIFQDDFQSQTIGALISGNGWTNYIQEGTEGFEAYTQGGTNSSLGTSCRVGSFNSGDASSIAWLITPAIDLDAQDGVTFQFKSSNSFSDGSELEILFSPDWDGTEANITTATWGILSAAYIVQDSDFFGAWFDSGIVDLSCVDGTIHIAFKYTGSGVAAFDGTFELDEISIDSN
jgi:Family of unknown function (DUF5689)